MLLIPAAVLVVSHIRRLVYAIDRARETDFGSFFRSAEAFIAGRNMYAPNFSNMNPPHFHLALLPLAGLGVGWAMLIWTLAGLAALFAALAIVAREIPRLTRPQRVFAIVGLTAFSGTAAVIGMGQVAFLLMLPLTIAWRAERHGRSDLAGLMVGLCATVKPFLLLFLVYFAARRRWRPAVVMLGAAALAIAGGLAVFGVDAYRDWITALRTADARIWGDLNASLLGLVSRSFSAGTYYQPLVTAPGIVTPIWLVLCAAVCAGILIRIRDASVDRLFTILLLGAMLLSPLGWIYYLWFALGPLAALWPTLPARDRKPYFWTAIPGLVWPPTSTLVGQPSAFATITIDSVYFWSVAALFVAAVCLDSEAPAPR